MSISGISGQANSNIQISIRLSQGRAAGAGGQCHACNDGDGDDGGASAGSAVGAQGTSAFASLAQQIQSAVDSAIKNLDPSASNNPLDIIKTILEAIDKALKDNSQGGSGTTDPSQTASGGAPAVDSTELTSATAASDGSTGASPSSGDTSPLPTSSADAASPTGPKSLLDSLLSQFGIDPQQFKTDLLSALGGSQNGNIDFSIVFKNFPVGQAINAQA